MSLPPSAVIATAPLRSMTNFTRDAPLQVGVVAHAVLVAKAEATEVLAHDALDDLGRQAPVDARRALANARGLDLVAAAETTAAAADALPRAGAGAVTEAAEVAEADALATTAAAFADARKAEAARAERIADGVAEHVAAGALLVLARGLFATPRAPWARSGSPPPIVEMRPIMPNCAASCRAACLARCGSGLSLGPWTPYLWPVVLRVRVTHRPLLALRRGCRCPLLFVGVGLGDFVGLALLLLALGCGVEQLLHHQDLVAIDVLAVVAAHGSA